MRNSVFRWVLLSETTDVLFPLNFPIQAYRSISWVMRDKHFQHHRTPQHDRVRASRLTTRASLTLPMSGCSRSWKWSTRQRESPVRRRLHWFGILSPNETSEGQSFGGLCQDLGRWRNRVFQQRSRTPGHTRPLQSSWLSLVSCAR